MPLRAAAAALFVACAATRATAAHFMLGESPEPPVTGARVSPEMEEIKAVISSLEADLKGLREGAEAPVMAVLGWSARYQEVFLSFTNVTTNQDEARKIALASVKERRSAVEAALKAKTLGWTEERKAVENRANASKVRRKFILDCEDGRKAGKVPDGCDKDNIGEPELGEALKKDVAYLTSVSEREPFAMRVLKRTLQDLDDEEDELETGKDFWSFHGARSERYQQVIADFQETLAETEGYFDYRHGHLLAELSRQKDFLCELEIKPALIAAGVIEDNPDFTPGNMIRDEAFLLHSAMEKQRELHYDEQKQLWKSLMALRAVLDDYVIPVEKTPLNASNASNASNATNATNATENATKNVTINCSNFTVAVNMSVNMTAPTGPNGTNVTYNVTHEVSSKVTHCCPVPEPCKVCPECPKPKPTEPPRAGEDWWGWRYAREGPPGLVDSLNDTRLVIEDRLAALVEVEGGLERHITWGMERAKVEDEPHAKENIMAEVNFSKVYLENLSFEINATRNRSKLHLENIEKIKAKLQELNMTSVQGFKTCNQYTCTFGHVKKPNATQIPGADDDHCCDKACTSFQCPAGTVWKSNASVVRAGDAGGDEATCCDKAPEAAPAPAPAFLQAQPPARHPALLALAGSGNDTNKSLHALLLEEVALIEQDLNETASRSLAFQFQLGDRLLECTSRKCSRLKEHFYHGGSIDASVNKLAHKAMTAPVALAASRRTQLRVDPKRSELEKARRWKALLSQVRLQLEERWRP